MLQSAPDVETKPRLMSSSNPIGNRMSSPAGKKVIIVGAGAQGIVITGVLAEAEDVAQIVLGDIDVSRAKEIAETNGSPKIRVIELDATDLEGIKAYGIDVVKKVATA
jgi:saccharopine dehydrogenase-like NADP-dependent oxidoreductase